MKIIGLLGAAGSGKSLAASLLKDKYGATIYSFAKPLKEIVKKAFGLTDQQVYGHQSIKEAVDPRYGVSPRWLLQKIGTEGVRSVLGEDFWWEHTMGKILDEQPELAVIDDFRFKNEVEGFLSLNGEHDPSLVKIWRIESPLPTGPVSTAGSQGHASEMEWASCPFTHLLKPEEYGLEYFYDELNCLAYECKLLIKEYRTP